MQLDLPSPYGRARSLSTPSPPRGCRAGAPHGRARSPPGLATDDFTFSGRPPSASSYGAPTRMSPPMMSKEGTSASHVSAAFLTADGGVRSSRRSAGTDLSATPEPPRTSRGRERRCHDTSCISRILCRLAWPRTILTRDGGTPRNAATARITASFARPSCGGAVTATRRCVGSRRLTRSCRARGVTVTDRRRMNLPPLRRGCSPAQSASTPSPLLPPHRSEWTSPAAISRCHRTVKRAVTLSSPGGANRARGRVHPCSSRSSFSGAAPSQN